MREYHLDLNDPAFIFDPYPLLADLRESLSVFYDPIWKKVFFTRYDHIAALLRDRRLGRTILHVLSRDELGWPPPNPLIRDFDRFQSNHMLDNEPPKHTRLRGLMLKAFTPARVERLRDNVQRIVDGLIDQVQDRREMDLLRDFAEPIPVAVIAELLGVPEADRPLLRPWSAKIVKLYELGYSDEQARAANQAVLEFSAYIKDLAADRRKRSRDDLISALVRVGEQGEMLTEDELVANCILLLNAGHEASVNGTTLGMLSLHRNPDQMVIAREAARSGHQEFYRIAVEELLRYDTPLPMFERWVLEDLDVDGVALRRGMEVGLFYASGNRDPRRFAHPDRLDLTRKDNPHLTFGLGIHYCVGAPLARVELQTSFAALLKRLPGLRIAREPVEYTGGFVIRGHKAMPGRVLDVQLAQLARGHIDYSFADVGDVVGGALQVAGDDRQLQRAGDRLRILDHEVEQLVEQMVAQLVNGVVLGGRAPGETCIARSERLQGVPDHLLNLRFHLGNVFERLEHRLGGEAFHRPRDAFRMVGHALQVNRDRKHGGDRTQVARHRLLQGQQPHTSLLQVKMQGVNGIVFRNDLLGHRHVAGFERLHRAVNRLAGARSHPHDVILQSMKLTLESLSRH